MTVIDEIMIIAYQIFPPLEIVIPLLMFSLLGIRGRFLYKVAVWAVFVFGGAFVLGLVVDMEQANPVLAWIYTAFVLLVWLTLVGMRIQDDGTADWFGIPMQENQE